MPKRRKRIISDADNADQYTKGFRSSTELVSQREHGGPHSDPAVTTSNNE